MLLFELFFKKTQKDELVEKLFKKNKTKTRQTRLDKEEEKRLRNRRCTLKMKREREREKIQKKAIESTHRYFFVARADDDRPVSVPVANCCLELVDADCGGGI